MPWALPSTGFVLPAGKTAAGFPDPTDGTRQGCIALQEREKVKSVFT